MIKAGLGDRIDGWIHTLFPFLFTRRLNPNLLTATGALISLAAAVAFAGGHFVAGALLLAAGGFFDLVDGVVARHQGIDSPFGAFLDSTLDRFVDVVVLFGIGVHFAGVGDPVLTTVVGVVLVMTVLTSYVKARVEAQGGVLEGGLLERGERVGILALGAVSGWIEPALWLLAAGTTITVAQRFRSAHRVLEVKTLEPVVPESPVDSDPAPPGEESP